jgi:hypothetical protein
MNIYAVLLDYDYRQLIDSSTKGSVATPQTDFRSILGTAEAKKGGRRIWIWKWTEQTQQIPEPQVFLTNSVTCYLLCSLLQSSHLISSHLIHVASYDFLLPPQFFLRISPTIFCKKGFPFVLHIIRVLKTVQPHQP